MNEFWILSHFPVIGKSFSGNRELIFREPVSFPEHIFWELWSHFPGTRKSISGNRETFKKVILFVVYFIVQKNMDGKYIYVRYGLLHIHQIDFKSFCPGVWCSGVISAPETRHLLYILCNAKIMAPSSPRMARESFSDWQKSRAFKFLKGLFASEIDKLHRILQWFRHRHAAYTNWVESMEEIW